jgi:hypothetical protein
MNTQAVRSALSARALLLLLSLAILPGSAPAWAMNASETPNMHPLPVGQIFPDLVFPGPFTPGEAKQLGIKPDAADYRLHDIKADTVILVVFSMYCPFCQKEGPALVRMNALLRERGLAGKVALVGLGAGNSAYEVGIYRDKFAVDFPLFQDKEFTAYKALGQVGTPYYYVLQRDAKGFTIIDGQLGCVNSPEVFLDGVLQKTSAAKGKKK